MATLTIGTFSSLVGSMSLDFVAKLSTSAVNKGHKVNIWLSGNATMLAKKGQKAFKDYSHLEKSLRELLSNGVEITTCEACTLARGIHKEDVIEGIKWDAMHWYLVKIANSDRVLHIGGE